MYKRVKWSQAFVRKGSLHGVTSCDVTSKESLVRESPFTHPLVRLSDFFSLSVKSRFLNHTVSTKHL